MPAAPVPAAPVPAAPVATRAAVTPTVTSIPADTKVSAMSVPTDVTTGDSVLATVAPRTAATFQLVGATWSSMKGAVTIQVKTLAGGTWSSWSTLDAEQTQDDKSSRPATEPVYVGDSTGVELRAVGAAGSTVTGLSAMTVTSPTVAADSNLGTVSAQSVAVTTGVAQPNIISRAGWGADESLRRWNGADCAVPKIDATVKGAVIHHTAGSNSYTAAQSASIVRGIYAYHVQGNGWCDIGYNFLVDMYGQIFEGRAGGITLPVHGAHATSWNTDTVGVSFMMNSDTLVPTTASMNSAEAVLAWKLGNSYRIPNGWTNLVGANIPVIFAHRDVMATDCPGTNLFARISDLRNTSTSLIGTRSALYELYMSLGGDGGTLGGVHELEHGVAGGSMVTFENGAAYQRPDGQTFWLGGTLAAMYAASGGPTGTYGWPTSSQVTQPSGDPTATFQNGVLPVNSTTTFAAASHYVPTTPARILDTRTTAAVGAGSAITLQIGGSFGVPSDASAVSLNVTVTDAHGGGYITVWPTGGTRPVVSNLNFDANQTVPNLVTVKLGTNGSISLFSSSPSTVNLVVDLGGYYATGAPTDGGGTVSVTPTRVLDTRIGLGGPTAIAANTDLALKVTGGVVPADAVAVLLNVTVSSASTAGWIAAYPAGVAVPTVSNLNFAGGQTRANLALVKIGTGGVVNVRNGTVKANDVVADIMGYITGSGTTGAYQAADQPIRLLDTRLSNSLGKPVPAQGDVTLPILGKAGVPSSGVSAVILNVTVTSCQTSGYVTVYASGTTQPGTSNLNFVTGATVPNQVVVAVGSDGAIVLHNGSAGGVQLIADIEGYIS